MAKAIIHSTHTSVYDYQQARRRGHVSIEIKAADLAERDSEWRSVMWQDDETVGAKLRRALIRDVIKLLKGLYPDSKISFSQKAGCTCGCSPGYYVKDANGNSMIPNGNTVFVDLVDD